MADQVQRFSHGPDGFWLDPDGLYMEVSQHQAIVEKLRQQRDEAYRIAARDVSEIQERAEKEIARAHEGRENANAATLREEWRAERAERERDQAIERQREIESKLESGYSFCHPESDCAGLRAAFTAMEERDIALSDGLCLAEDCIEAAAAQDRLREGLEEPGGGDIELGEAKECEGKAKAFREVAERIRIRDEQKAGS